MDQLKPILENMSKHRFWITCGVIALAGLVVSWLATSNVQSQTAEMVSKITSSFSNTSALKGVKPDEGLTNIADDLKSQVRDSFPNKETLAEMDRVTDAAKLAAAEAWQYRYDQQQSLLVFPADLAPPVRVAFSSLLPIEQKLPKFDEVKSADQEARVEYRMAYGDYIKERLPQLADLIGARWNPAGGGTAAAGMMGSGSMSGGPSGPGSGALGSGPGIGSTGLGPGGAATPEVDDRPPVVNWNPANQGYWLSKTTVFTGRNKNVSNTNVPTTHQVMYLQEDLWVLEAVFSVIKGVNGDADANDLVDIKTVDHILVGASAGEIGSISKLDDSATPAAGGASGGMSRDMMKSMTNAMPGGAGSSNAAAAAVPSDDPAHRRYVDRDYKLLDSTAFHSALTASDPSEAYLQVAKRIPVRLGFQMKETALIDLLAQCANSNPPIEVRQVRINRHKPEAGSDGAGGMGMMGSGSGGSSAGGMPAIGSQTGSGGGASASGIGAMMGGSRPSETNVVQSDVVGIEIYGVVYIFNPVPAGDEESNILKLANPAPNADQAADRSRRVAPVTAG